MKKIAIFLISLSFNTNAKAHPISISEAHARVTEHNITVTISLYPEDFTFYQGIQANEAGYFSQEKIQSAAKNHKFFLQKHFYIHNQFGKRLQGSAKIVKYINLKKEGLHVSRLMKDKIVYQLSYPLKQAPKFLTFYQFLGGGRNFPALMDLFLSQNGGPTTAPVRLSNGGNKKSFGFSWHSKKAQVTALALDIETVKSVLNRDLQGITWKIYFPFKLLDSWVSIPRKNPIYLNNEEIKSAKYRIDSFLQKNLEFKHSEDKLCKAKFHSQFVEGGINLKKMEKRKIPEGLNTLISGIYVEKFIPSTKAYVPNITIQWKHFRDGFYEFPVDLYGFEGHSKMNFLTSYKPVLTIKGIATH